MKLSIIIPVYRTQDTLSRCLESILCQSFTDYEMILVDDGSPDECPRLCDEYAARNKNILVIHKENGGLSDARNRGIKQAQGDYITFVDSDDTIVDNTLEKLMKELQEHPHVDILEYPVLERCGNKDRQTELNFTPREYTHPLEYWLEEKGYHHTYACNKIYKRHLFDHIEFPKDRTFEDVWTTPLLIGLVHKTEDNITCQQEKSRDYEYPIIRMTNVGKYIYHWNNQGITANAKYEDLYQLYAGYSQSLRAIMNQIEIQEELIQKYNVQLQDFILQILNVLLDLYELSGKYEDNPPIIHYVEKLGKVVKIKDFKLRLLNLLGYHNLCRLNRIIHRMYRHR